MTALDDNTVERLTDLIGKWTGFSRDAIPREVVRRAVRSFEAEHPGEEKVLQRAVKRDPDLVSTLCKAVSVGETYFFRQPEHFDYVAAHTLGRWSAPGTDRLRAWSAGCATGEEAYSLAACLLATAPAQYSAKVQVLGTDLLEGNIATARAGAYGRWSTRSPMRYPGMRPTGDGRVQVDARIRATTTFAVHNLLDPPPDGGPFDVIFCRNVLVYFSSESTRSACTNLMNALTPGGIVVFGAMDVTESPTGLVRIGAPELNTYMRPVGSPAAETARRSKPQPPVRTSRTKARRPGPPSSASTPKPRTSQHLIAAVTAHVALHMKVLASIDRGDQTQAKELLSELARSAPDYLPGLFERALFHLRKGEPGRATTLMREVLRRAEALPLGMILSGPEALPVGYYMASARAFLDGKR